MTTQPEIREKVAPGKSINQLFEDLHWKGDQLNLSEDQLSELGVFSSWSTAKDSWDGIRHAVESERAKRDQTITIESFKSAVRDKLIEHWLDDNTQVKEKYQRQQLRNTVATCVSQGREEELSLYLLDVIAQGPKFADNEWEKRRRRGGKFGHVWTAVCGLIQLLICIAVISIGDTRFERIVLPGLVLIYLGLDAGAASFFPENVVDVFERLFEHAVIGLPSAHRRRGRRLVSYSILDDLMT